MNFWSEFQLLRSKTPRLGSFVIDSTNSDYSFATQQCTDSYFLLNSIKGERCLYSENLFESSECVDSTRTHFSARCYECIDCSHCEDCEYVQQGRRSRNSSFCYDIEDCIHCVGCVGLKGKKFHIFNKPYTAADFFLKMRSLKERDIKKNFELLVEKTPRAVAQADWNFDVTRTSDSIYVYDGADIRDCVDCTVIEKSTDCYEVTDGHNLENATHCFMSANSHDIHYCEFVFDSSFCFGCVGLKEKQYYILNKSYSKEEYFKKVEEIKIAL